MKEFFRSAAVLVLAAAFSICPALALTVDQTRIMSPRAYANYQPQYWRVTINFNDQNIGAGQQFGALATNEFIKAIDCYVSTAFNAATTNVITFGTTKANANEIVASGISGAPLAVGILHLTAAAGLGTAVTATGPVTMFAKYTQTGASATTGSMSCVIETVSNNDM